MPDTLDAALAALPFRHPGPGGAVAVLRDGAVIGERCWGWADAARRIPFTRTTHSLICSITKQFTCALLLDLFPDPDVLDGDVAAAMPLLARPPSIREMCHNQSGLRDYWALAMLCGSPVDRVFGGAEAAWLIGRTRSLHFAPGTRYSYVNQNFRIVSDIVAARAGRPFAELLRTRILDRAGMPHARLNPDTSAVAGGTIGYEGTPADGFFPAPNNIVWTGDAGLAATLEDMIAWERFIDATRDDADGLYRRLSAPTRFRDDTPAPYGFGIRRDRMAGCEITCHSGGLRGWRSIRLYAPAERISVVVLFNHMADPRPAAEALFRAALGIERQTPAPTAPGEPWSGRFVEAETGLATRLEPLPDGKLRLHYGLSPETLSPAGPDSYAGNGTVLVREPGGLRLRRAAENLSAPLLPCDGPASTDIEGTWHSTELDATLTVATSGGVLYAAFSGALGEGEMLALVPHGDDVWLFPCPRALDFGAPGDWTLAFRRDGAGRIASVQVGCWLARDVVFIAR